MKRANCGPGTVYVKFWKNRDRREELLQAGYRFCDIPALSPVLMGKTLLRFRVISALKAAYVSRKTVCSCA